MSFAVTLPNNFVEGVMLGSEEGGQETRDQLGALLMDGED